MKIFGSIGIISVVIIISISIISCINIIYLTCLFITLLISYLHNLLVKVVLVISVFVLCQLFAVDRFIILGIQVITKNCVCVWSTMSGSVFFTIL